MLAARARVYSTIISSAKLNMIPCLLADVLDAEDDAHKLYDRNIRNTKADLLAYERQKEAALGLAPGTLVPAGASSTSIARQGGSSSRGLTLAEDLYRGADTLSYGDSKPSEEAVDRLTAKINKECVIILDPWFPHTATQSCWRGKKTKTGSGADKSSMDKGKKRNRPKKDEETDVTYINDRNKVFNKKLVRYFDKYTKECVFFPVIPPALQRRIRSQPQC